MRIDVIEYSDKGLKTVAVSHNDQTSTWDVRAYLKTNKPSEDETGERAELIFKEINSFWETLPEERQLGIWHCYQEIFEILTNNWDALTIRLKLQYKIKALYDLMPLDELRHWAQYYGDIRIPSNLTAQYDPTGPYLKERTYLRTDYHELVVLAIACRPMVPIWGEYITRTRSETGTTYKETAAMKLLYHSSLAKCEPMTRLRSYIESSAEHSPQQGPSFAAILQGLGTTELPDWLLASTVVRRIAVVPVSAVEDKSSIIANVNNYISNTMRSIDRRFGGHVSEKNRRMMEQGDDPNISLAEMYKVKQEIPDGARVILNVYTENPIEMAVQVDTLVDLEKVEAALKLLPVLETLPIHNHQIVLAQWVMAGCLPSRGVQGLDKPAALRTLCVTQALLWHWGFFDLAVMVTAEEVAMDSDVMISTLDYRSRLPKDLLDEMVKRWPHQHHPRGKHQSVRQTNVASRAVDSFCSLITANEWRLHAPPELIASCSKTAASRNMVVPPDIRNQVANLLIYLNDAAASYV